MFNKFINFSKLKHFGRLKVKFYERSRSDWMEGSLIRTDEFRKTAVDLKIPKSIDGKSVEKVSLKMIKNGFLFGATMRKNFFDDDYYTEPWADLFNFGVAE